MRGLLRGLRHCPRMVMIIWTFGWGFLRVRPLFGVVVGALEVNKGIVLLRNGITFKIHAKDIIFNVNGVVNHGKTDSTIILKNLMDFPQGDVVPSPEECWANLRISGRLTV